LTADGVSNGNSAKPKRWEDQGKGGYNRRGRGKRGGEDCDGERGTQLGKQKTKKSATGRGCSRKANSNKVNWWDKEN